jgi:molecular chaperone GrpE
MGAAGAVSGDIVSGDISQLQNELAETTNHLQRMAADFDNFRKRAIREREMASQMADAKLLGELLVVLDDFDRALEGAAADGATVESVCEGVKMVDGRLRSVLTAAGLAEVPVDGQFDPHLHEALLVQPGSGKAEGEIIQVVQRGYQLKDRVIRHAKVIVAGAE